MSDHPELDARLAALEARISSFDARLARFEARLAEPESGADGSAPWDSIRAELDQLRRAMIIRFGAAEAVAGPGSSARTSEDAAAGAGPPPAGTHPPAAGAQPPPSTLSRSRASIDLEAWFGKNALLVVGMLALVAAAGFALEHAFEQGWLSPLARVTAGFVAGIGLAVWGHRLTTRGLSRYGAALVGGGGALAYLAGWAAAGPYALLPEAAGVALLVTVAALVTASAAAAGSELLAALAAAGAFTAPVVLPEAGASPIVLLAYAALVAAGAGGIAARRGWGLASGVAMLGFFALPTVVEVITTVPVAAALYLAAGGAAWMTAGRSRRWRLQVRGAFLLAWPLMIAAADAAAGTPWREWIVVAAAAALAAPPFLWRLRSAGGSPDRTADRVERVHLYAAAFALGVVTLAANAEVTAPGGADPTGLRLALLALPFVLASVFGRAPAHHVAGFGLLAWGAAVGLEGLSITAAWGALACGSGLLTRDPRLAPVRWTGLALASVAALRLLMVDVAARDELGPAFTGTWSIVFYMLVLVFATLAALAGASGREADRAGAGVSAHGLSLRSGLWSGAGIVLFIGGTLEIVYYFWGTGLEANRLERDLAVSAYWMLYALALVAAGFWRGWRAVRVAGLIVAGAAILKVALYDLTALEALYRVASFFLLAAIALAVAFAYHRRGRGESDESVEAGMRRPG